MTDHNAEGGKKVEHREPPDKTVLCEVAPWRLVRVYPPERDPFVMMEFRDEQGNWNRFDCLDHCDRCGACLGCAKKLMYVWGDGDDPLPEISFSDPYSKCPTGEHHAIADWWAVDDEGDE